jgi:hypothetical protein
LKQRHHTCPGHQRMPPPPHTHTPGMQRNSPRRARFGGTTTTTTTTCTRTHGLGGGGPGWTSPKEPRLAKHVPGPKVQQVHRGRLWAQLADDGHTTRPHTVHVGTRVPLQNQDKPLQHEDSRQGNQSCQQGMRTGGQALACLKMMSLDS